MLENRSEYLSRQRPGSSPGPLQLLTAGRHAVRVLHFPRRVGHSSVVVRASEVTYEIAPEGPKDYAPVLGVIAFVAAIQGRLSITCTHHILNPKAWLKLIICHL